MKEYLQFDDVLIVPKFSEVESRKNVNLETNVGGIFLDLPVIGSNMDTVTNGNMAYELRRNGAIGCIHRFQSVEENKKQFIEGTFNDSFPMVSVGMGNLELGRAQELAEVGAEYFLLDVAHAAARHVVEQYNHLRNVLPSDSKIIVGNFATKEGILEFNKRCTRNTPDAYKVGIGGGSMCTTRIVTGSGLPTLGSVMDCVQTGFPIIADGGIRTSGDIAKCLAVGCKAVMLGYMLAGTDETPGVIIQGKKGAWTQVDENEYEWISEEQHKVYRGSASKESYAVQGKESDWRTPEGESTLVPYKGPVTDVLKQIEGGLRSALSYVGAKNLEEFQAKAEFVRVTNNGSNESRAHGKLV